LLSAPEVQRIAQRLTQRYVVAYYHTLQALTIAHADPSPSLAAEMAFAAAEMKLDIPKFDLILDFIAHDVVNTSATPTLAQQLERHILDLTSYRETDLCESECMRRRGEKLFVSTVHKAKGLEFDNVIITGVVDSIYPFYRSTSNEERLEDARKFYVALSRAKKRIYICHYRVHSFIDRSGTPRTFARNISPFCHYIAHHLKPLVF
jgi:DNA helicase-2/ATP-dependent DNA helicase PcrA